MSFNVNQNIKEPIILYEVTIFNVNLNLKKIFQNLKTKN